MSIPHGPPDRQGHPAFPYRMGRLLGKDTQPYRTRASSKEAATRSKSQEENQSAKDGQPQEEPAARTKKNQREKAKKEWARQGGGSNGEPLRAQVSEVCYTLPCDTRARRPHEASNMWASTGMSSVALAVGVLHHPSVAALGATRKVGATEALADGDVAARPAESNQGRLLSY